MVLQQLLLVIEVIKKAISLEYTNARYNTYEQYNILYADSVPFSLTGHVYQNERKFVNGK